MKRRGFLAFLGGAAVAGPGAAKNVTTKAFPITEAQIAGNLIAQSGPSYGQLGIFNKFDRMMKLKRLIAGEEQEDTNPFSSAHARQIKAEHAVNALHSVSHSQKINILQRRVKEIEAERNKAAWLAELLGLEKDPL